MTKNNHAFVIPMVEDIRYIILLEVGIFNSNIVIISMAAKIAFKIAKI
jgi:hypothetical protein